MSSYAVSNPVQTVFGDQKIVFCRLTGNGAAYTAGGDTVSVDLFGMKRVEFIIFSPISTAFDVTPSFLRGASGATPKITLSYPNSVTEFSGPNSKVFDAIVIGQ